MSAFAAPSAGRQLAALARLLVPGSWRHARAHAGITLVALSGIALGVATLVAVRLTTESAGQSFASALDAVAGRATLSVRAATGTLPDDVYARMRPLLPFARLWPVAETTAYVSSGDGAGKRAEALTLLGIDLVAAANQARKADAGAAAGGSPKALLELLAARTLLLPGETLARLGVADGATVSVLVNDRRVAMTARRTPSGSDSRRALEAGMAVQDLGAFQATWGRPGLDRIDVEPRAGVEGAELEQRVRAVLPAGYRVEPPARRGGQVDRMLRAYRFNLGALAFVALLVGGFFIHNATAVAVARRQGEIALMRALGATRGQVTALFLAEAALTGFAAWFPGLGLGWLMARLGVDAVAKTVNAFYAPTRVQLGAITPGLALGSLGLAIAVTVCAALVPAREAAACDPATRLRPGARGLASAGRAGPLFALGLALLALAGPLCGLPAVNGLPLFGMAGATAVVIGTALLLPAVFAAAGRGRALRRDRPAIGLAAAILGAYPGRAAVAAASLVAAVALVGSMDLMVSSFRQTVMEWVGQTLTGDVFIRPAGRSGSWTGDVGQTLVDELKRTPGVADVDRITVVPLDLDQTTVRLQLHDMQVMERHGRLAMVDGSPFAPVARQLARGEGVLISEPLAYRRGLAAGDDLTLPTPSGPVAVKVLGVYLDYTYDQGVIRLDRALHDRLFTKAALGGLTLYLDPAGLEAAVERVRAAVAGRLVVIARPGEIRRDAADIFDQTFAVTRALKGIATVVALLGILGTLVLFVQVELPTFALLRMIGATASQVRRVVFAMGLALGLCGTAGGLLAGYAVSRVLIHVVNKQSFGWTIVPHGELGPLVGTALAVPLAALVAALLPARAVAGASPAAALRAE